MATPTNKELEERREKIRQLRGKDREARSRREAAVQEESRAITAARQDAEIERLEKQLEKSRESAKKTSVREGTKNVVSQIESDGPTPAAPGAPQSDTDDKKKG